MPSLFRRQRKRTTDPEQTVADAPPPAPEYLDVLDGSREVYYSVREPWQWVMRKVAAGAEHVHEVEVAELPSSKLAALTAPTPDAPTPLTPSARRKKKKNPGPCTLRLEVPDASGEIMEAVHACSEAFDGLEDKDELVRTVQRCRCEHLELTPPSRLINWDVTKEECMNLVGDSLPKLLANEGKETVAVLKEPMGTRGTGVFFVKDAHEIHEIIEVHRKRAVDDPEFLDNLIAVKGRIPSWGKCLFVLPYSYKQQSFVAKLNARVQSIL